MGDLKAGTGLDAARRHGRPHLIYVSIVKVDRVPVGYYRGRQEATRSSWRSSGSSRVPGP